MTGGFRKFINAVLFWGLALAGLGMLFMVLALPIMRKRHTMEVVVDQMTQRNDQLAGRLDRIEKERIALVSADPFFVEKLAREDLHMVRPGEGRLENIPAETRDVQPPTRPISPGETVGIWRVCATLRALSEDKLLRQIALILGGLTIVAAIVLFGRNR